MLIALLISLIFGGSSELVVIPKFQKYANVVILDDDRLNQVKEISKSTKKTRKTFNKEYGKLKKDIKRLNASYFRTEEDFKKSKKELKKLRSKISEFEIERYLSFDKLILDNEWNQIIESSAKDFKKYRKNGDKSKKEFDKQMAKLQEKLMKQFVIKGNREKAKEYVNSFQKDVELLKNKQRKYSIAYNTNIQNKRLQKGELQKLFREWNLLQGKLDDEFIQFRFKLLKLSSEDSWKPISKQMNKLF